MNRGYSTETAKRRIFDATGILGRVISRRAEIDLRALAAFRIALGALLLVDLALRSRSLVAFYTDDGVLPREAFFADYAGSFSFHALSGEPWAVAALFVVAGAFALTLLVGYQTRATTIVSWVLLLSLQARNPMVLNSGDTLLAIVLFWAMFLPLGARWSVDAAQSARSGEDGGSTVASVATLALLVQVVLMYVTNAIHKSRSDLWMDGEAVVYIMQGDQFTIYLGNYLAEFHGLLRAVTVVWIVLLFAAPLLVVLTGVPRAVLASLYVGMHLGMVATMRIGMFPVIVAACFIPFYQSVVWDTGSRFATRAGLADTLDDLLERLRGRLPSGSNGSNVENRPGGSDQGTLDRSVDHGRVLFSTVIPGVILVLVVLSNAQAVDYTEVPDPAEDVTETLELDQSWRMFAPNPAHTTAWYAAPGVLENGTEVDVIYGGSVTYDRPPNVDATYPSARWRKYRGNVFKVDNRNHRSYYANYLCEKWNRSHETNVETVTVYRVYEETDPYNGTVREGKFPLVEYDCSGDLVQREDQ